MTRAFATFRDRLQFVAHLITAGVIVLEGVSRCDHLEENWPFVAVLFASGTVVLLITVGHERIARRFRHSQAVLYVVEALVSIAIGAMYAREGKILVQYPFFLVSYLFAGLAGHSLGRPPDSQGPPKRAGERSADEEVDGARRGA